MATLAGRHVVQIVGVRGDVLDELRLEVRGGAGVKVLWVDKR